MQRLVSLGLAVPLTLLLAGCPLYDDEARCDEDFELCGANAGGATSFGCDAPSDCGVNETCGSDNQCHPGDCTFWGCPGGYSCTVGANQTAECLPLGTGGNGGSGAAGGNGGSGASAGAGGGGDEVYCGNPDDCGDGETCGPDGTCQPGDCSEVGCIFGFACDDQTGACEHENPAACGEDADCATAGVDHKCVSGICTPPEDQCFDQTQCGGGQVCAAGKCTDECNGSGMCDGAYACDPALDICTDPIKTCSITNDCGGPDEVCVDGACVPRADGGACDGDLVWVENGCIADQAASFICVTDGQQDACAAGSICLHHSCYISCAPPNQNACDVLPSFDVCKTVTTVSGEHQVCGSSDNLGGECDPTSGVSCPSGKICIDGFCK